MPTPPPSAVFLDRELLVFRCRPAPPFAGCSAPYPATPARTDTTSPDLASPQAPHQSPADQAGKPETVSTRHICVSGVNSCDSGCRGASRPGPPRPCPRRLGRLRPPLVPLLRQPASRGAKQRAQRELGSDVFLSRARHIDSWRPADFRRPSSHQLQIITDYLLYESGSK